MQQDINWIWKSPKLKQLSIANFKRYIATLYKLTVIDKIKFDTIVVGGNTGLIMGHWAQMFFDQQNIERPILLKTTPQRYYPKSEEEVDNSILTLDLENQIYDYKINSIKNILFVDDEIYKGTTAETCIKAIIYAIGEKELINYYIVAEDQGFNMPNYGSNVISHFYPFAKEIEGLNNVITYLTPSEIYRAVKGSLSEKMDIDKYILNILMSLSSRDKNLLFDGFDYRLNYLAEQALTLETIDKLKHDFELFIRRLIADAVAEYNNGRIQLDDYSYINEYSIPD